MKKILSFLLTLALLFSLAACGGGDDDKTSSNDDKTPSSSGQQQQTQTSKPDESEQSDESEVSDEELIKKANEIAAAFGSYNGNPLVWNVLAVDTENEKALLLTEKCIDILAFHESDSTFTWESSEIRAWLIGEFYDNTFSDTEKALILETINKNSANSQTSVTGCDDTTDRVFLLSEKEALEYFETDDERIAETYDGDIFQWWLRTPGESEDWFMLVNDSGGLYYTGSTSTSSYGVRPAVWVNLSDEQADPVEDEPEETPDDGGEASLDNVTDSNYAALAKELFGIDVDPEGDWELIKAESTLTIGGGMGIVYHGSATVDSKELMKAYYDATADISTAGICIGQFDSISEPFADFEAFFEEGTKAGGSVGEWIYEYGGKKIELMFALSPETELTITIDFLADNKYS